MPRRVSLPNADDLFRGNGHDRGGTTRELDPPSERTNPAAKVVEQPAQRSARRPLRRSRPGSPVAGSGTTRR